MIRFDIWKILNLNWYENLKDYGKIILYYKIGVGNYGNSRVVLGYWKYDVFKYGIFINVF